MTVTGPRTVLAIDGGNSKTDVVLVREDGTVLARARGGPSNHQIIGMDAAFATLRGLVETVRSTSGVAADHVHACLAGVDLDEEERLLGARLVAEDWAPTAGMVNDTFAVLRSGLPDRAENPAGLAVVCGAGLNCVGAAPDGRTTRFLALGEMSGDWGGGGDIGQSAAWAAIRAEDGRGPPTVLQHAVAEHFGFDHAIDVALARYNDKLRYEDLYDLVPVVFRAARDGDDVAGALLDRLANEICTMAVIVADRLGLPSQPFPVVLGGSLLTADDPALRARVLALLTARLPDADVVRTSVAPIAGAALLGFDHLGASAGAKRAVRAAFGQRPA